MVRPLEKVDNGGAYKRCYLYEGVKDAVLASQLLLLQGKA